MSFNIFTKVRYWEKGIMNTNYLRYDLSNIKRRPLCCKKTYCVIQVIEKPEITKTVVTKGKKKYIYSDLLLKKNKRNGNFLITVAHFCSSNENVLNKTMTNKNKTNKDTHENNTVDKKDNTNDDMKKDQSGNQIKGEKENIKFQENFVNTNMKEKGDLMKKKEMVVENEEEQKRQKNLIEKEEENKTEEEIIDDIKKKEKKKWTKFRIFYYSFNTIFLSYVIYKVYKNDMNLSKAEESITTDFIKIFYSFEEKKSLANSEFVTCLDEQLNKQIAMYFMQLDTDKSSGFLRNDAINFLSELHIKEDDEIVQKFINQGIGKQKELKKISGCSLQEFAALIENIILRSKTRTEKQILPTPKKPTPFENTKQFYLSFLQYYLDTCLYYWKTSSLYIHFQKMKQKGKEEETTYLQNLENIEKKILDKLTKYNEQYVDKNNLPLLYILSEEEVRQNRTTFSDESVEREILLIEKKKIEETIHLLNKLKLKKELSETEIQRLNHLKGRLKNIKRTIWKEELKKYFFM